MLGLVINRFNGSGVLISGRGGDFLQGDYFGTSVAGNVSLGNRAYGVDVLNSPNNVIGGAGPLLRDVISGNVLGGVQIAGAGSSGDVVTGDYIGTNAAGTAAVPNGQNGVWIDNAVADTVANNVVSGNSTNGIKLYGPVTTLITVKDNVIGGPAMGRGWIGNQGFGILLSGLSKKGATRWSAIPLRPRPSARSVWHPRAEVDGRRDGNG